MSFGEKLPALAEDGNDTPIRDVADLNAVTSEQVTGNRSPRGAALLRHDPGSRPVTKRVCGTLARFSRTSALPALPAAASAALGMARDPEADIDECCRVIQSGIGLPTCILA